MGGYGPCVSSHMRSLANALVIALAAAVPACAAADDGDPAGADEAAATESSVRPSDPNATPATRTVLTNLRSFDFGSADPFDHRVLVGQEGADVSNRSTYGVARVPSDVEVLTGRFPGLVSYDLSSAYPSASTMFDVTLFRRGWPALRELILDKHAKGVLVSLVWHMKCPKTAGDPDRFAPNECPADYRLEELLERKRDGSRGAHFVEWRRMLDELAELLWSLKDASGALVPVQIRPFHEHTGGWFWWGNRNPAAIWQQAWREMVDYLRDGRGLHHLLWVYCPAAPSDFSWRGTFETFYPGDAYVDVVAFDRYDADDGRFARRFDADLDRIGSFARAHDKVAAVAEVGLRTMGAAGGPRDTAWFTQTLLAPLKKPGRAFAYVGLWRNAPWEKFVPEPGDGAIAEDFRRFSADGGTLFAGRHDLYRPLHAP